MRYLLIIVVLLFSIVSFAQDYEQSGSCQDDNNANCNKWWQSLENSKRAVFNWGTTFFNGTDPEHDHVECTGVLINQCVNNENDIEQYFVTAKHCIDGKDLNGDFVFIFNYQSPTCDNDDVPLNNRGKVGGVHQGVRYRHVSTITEIDQLWAPDMALFRINNPIPPHFNVYYAGWTKAIFQGTQFPHHVIHHPKGDIKKIANTWSTVTITNTTCHVVTTVIDAIFSWLGITINTEVICTYTESPQYSVPFLFDGALEKGSSGSALLNSNMRIIGTLAWGFPVDGCIPEAFVNQFGRFNTAWLNSSAMRNALNPNGDYIYDGISGNQIECYDELLNLNGEYYPAIDYQQENHITLHANNNITTNGNLTIHSGADFEFLAGERITLNPGFNTEPGAHFVAQAGMPCVNGKSNKKRNLFNDINEIYLPKYKEFKISDYIIKTENDIFDENIFFSLYPNPNNGEFKAIITGNNDENISLSITNVLGEKIYSKINIISQEFEINISDQPKGIYFIRIIAGEKEFKEKAVVN
jgi:hypothetical protein